MEKKTKYMISQDGDLHVFNPEVAKEKGWLEASDEEVKAFFDSGPTPVAEKYAEAAPGPKDPDACDSLDEAIEVVMSMTANECDAYAGKLGMEPFTARVKVGDKRDAVVEKMKAIAAEKTAAMQSTAE